MIYVIVYEKSSNGWGAYAPDLPELGVVGQTLEETKQLIREAIEFHLEGLREHGDPIPAPSAKPYTLLFDSHGVCGPPQRLPRFL
jgi:predicted RNase H-like HicB family nuclease